MKLSKIEKKLAKKKYAHIVYDIDPSDHPDGILSVTTDDRIPVEAYNGKPFTGWSGDAYTKDDRSPRGLGASRVRELDEHRLYMLTFKVVTFMRGRSSIAYICEDKSGYTFRLPATGTMTLLEFIQSGKIIPDADGYFTAHFEQSKRGQDYFLELVDVEAD